MNQSAVRSQPLPPIAHLLKAWRGTRRLSQQELSLNSGVSQRQLSFIESGRARPGRDTVLQLAEALEVPLRERNTLLAAAGFAHVYEGSTLDDPAMAAVRKALDLLLRQHEPNPAVLIDRHTNVLGGNQAALRLFGRFVDLAALRSAATLPNLLRLSFDPRGLRPHILNWAEAAPVMLQRAQRDALARGDEAYLRLLDEISAYPGVPEQWRRPQMQAPGAPVLPLEYAVDGRRLRLFTMVSAFGWPQEVITEEVRVESFFAADEDSAQLLRELAQA
jgi:transcriptional regulator with XRE-family HTH domain